MNSAGHQIVPRPFRGTLDQDRGLDLDKAPLIQEIAHELDHPMAQKDVLLHPGAAQIEIAVAEAKVFVHINILIDIKGGCL
ncbi:hypothetical protein ES703_07430 [subsurface metagenome]